MKKISIYKNTYNKTLLPSVYNKNYFVAQAEELDRLQRLITTYVWSPIVFKDNYRHGNNFISADYFVLDFDDGEMTLDQAVNNVFCDMKHVIATTKSHQIVKGNNAACDRFRVIVPLERTITRADEYVYNMTVKMKMLPCDQSAKDSARFFYPCVSVASVQTEGFEEKVLEGKLEVKRPVNPQPEFIGSGAIPSHFRLEMDRVIPKGERNTTVFKWAIKLTEYGLTGQQTMDKILSSRTYAGTTIGPDLFQEISQCVENGVKRGLINLSNR